MSLSITQSPPRVALSQSPIAFTVNETGSIITSSSFQYVADLYYWTGSVTESGSVPDYTLVKFPNQVGRGIFDISKIIDSTLADSREKNPSNVVNYAVEFRSQFQSGSTTVTGSTVRSLTNTSIDGYSLFQEPIGLGMSGSTPYWPIMTSGPDEQDVLPENRGTIGVWNGIEAPLVDYLIVSASTGQNQALAYPGPSSTTNTSGSVYQLAAFPSSPGALSFVTSSLVDWYTIQLGIDLGTAIPITPPIKFYRTCPTKYPNVRIKWKNKFGQYDYLNFNLVSQQSFDTDKQTFQKQLGTWNGTSLSYQPFDNMMQNYNINGMESINVNTNWLTEDYNDILKQLMVSDEIYWVFNEAQNLVRPLTIETSNLIFKTGVVDKLIQYQMEFRYGQTYKLII